MKMSITTFDDKGQFVGKRLWLMARSVRHDKLGRISPDPLTSLP